MTSDWQRIRDLFDEASILAPSERDSFLIKNCGTNAELLTELQALIDPLELERPRGSFVQQMIQVSNERHREEDRILGPYRLETCIATGGMGSVWRAYRSDDEYRKVVAIKIIKRGSDSDAIIARFRQERQVLADLEHPNITRLIDGGTSVGGRPYLVMELVEGAHIDDYCLANECSIGARLQLMIRVCEAVDHAHEMGIVHRDLKPSNILVTAGGEPKLLDFGIARLLDCNGTTAPSLMTRTGERLLTPRYAAPEQITGQVASKATDVHALGAILHELLTGHSPFGSETTIHELEMRICNQEPRRPSTLTTGNLRRRLRGDLDVILLRSLSKDPQRRYSTAGELAADLKRHLAKKPILAGPDSAPYRIRKFVGRNKALVVATVSIMLALSLGLIGAIHQYLRAERSAEESHWSAYVYQIQTASYMIRSGRPAIRVLRDTHPKYRGWEWRHLMRRTDLSQRSLFEGKNLNHLSLDAKGDRLAVRTDDHVVVIDVKTGSTILRVRLESTTRDLAISPDGEVLVWAHQSGLRAWRVDSNQHIADWSHTSPIYNLAFHPDGRRIVATHTNYEIAIYNLAINNDVRKLCKVEGCRDAIAISPDSRHVAIVGKASRIVLIGFDTGEVLWEAKLDSAANTLSAVAFSTLSPIVAAASYNGVIRAWSVATGLPETPPIRKGMFCGDMQFVPGRDELAIALAGISVHDLESGKARMLLGTRGGTTRSIAMDSSNARIFACDKNQILMWSLRDEQIPRHEIVSTQIDKVTIHPTKRRFAVRYGTFLKYMAIKHDSKSTVTMRTSNDGDAQFSPSGESYVSVGRNGIQIWDLEAGDLKKTIDIGSAAHADFSRGDGTLFATAAGDKVLVFATKTWKPVRTATTPWKSTKALKFLPDGTLLIAGSSDPRSTQFALFDPRIEKWTDLFAVVSEKFRIAISPDGRLVAVTSPKGDGPRLHVRAIADGRTVMEAKAELPGAREVAFSPDGSRLFVSANGLLAIYETRRWRLAAVFDERMRGILSMSIASDGSTLLTGDLSGEVRVWRTRKD